MAAWSSPAPLFCCRYCPNTRRPGRRRRSIRIVRKYPIAAMKPITSSTTSAALRKRPQKGSRRLATGLKTTLRIRRDRERQQHRPGEVERCRTDDQRADRYGNPKQREAIVSFRIDLLLRFFFDFRHRIHGPKQFRALPLLQYLFHNPTVLDCTDRMRNRLPTRPFVEIFSELCKTQNLVASKSAEEWRCAPYFSIFVFRHIDCSLCRISSEGASEPLTYITPKSTRSSPRLRRDPPILR